MTILDLTPADLQIKVTRGDTYSLNLEILNDDDSPRDITGATITLTVEDGTTQVMQKTATLTDAVNGQANVTIETADWVDVEPRFYKYDIEMVESSGDVTTLFIGEFNVYNDVKQ